MTDELPPPADHDTLPPDSDDTEAAFRNSTLPPFASDKRVKLLERQHREVMGELKEIRAMLATLIDGSLDARAAARENEARLNQLAGRVAALDRKREGSNGSNAVG